MTKSDTYDRLCIYLWYLFVNDLRYIMNSNDKIAYELLGKLYLVLVDVSLFWFLSMNIHLTLCGLHFIGAHISVCF